jgi:pterin-4a-carbinolamine dehydratase
MNSTELINQFAKEYANDIRMLTLNPELIHKFVDYKTAIKFIVQINVVAEYSKNKELEALYEKLAFTMSEKHGDKVFTDLIMAKI